MVGWIATATDIYDQKKAEEILLQAVVLRELVLWDLAVLVAIMVLLERQRSQQAR